MTATREQASQAARRRDWQAAYDAYAGLDSRTADDAEGFADAAWWLGRMEESIGLYDEAFHAHLAGDDARGAARTAFLLAMYTRLIGEAARSAGGSRAPVACSRVCPRASSTATRSTWRSRGCSAGTWRLPWQRPGGCRRSVVGSPTRR